MKLFALAASMILLSFASLGCGGDSSPAADAAPGAHIDAAAPGTPDAAPGPADAAIGVACGAAATCSTSQVCCVTANGDGGTSMCISPGTCQGVSARCDGPEDCGGHACCGTVVGAPQVACTTTDTCSGSGTFQACHEPANCPASAPMCCVLGTTGYCAASCQ